MFEVLCHPLSPSTLQLVYEECGENVVVHPVTPSGMKVRYCSICSKYVFRFADRKRFNSAAERVLVDPGRTSWLSPRTSHIKQLSVSLLVSNIHDIDYLGQPIAQNPYICLNN